MSFTVSRPSTVRRRGAALITSVILMMGISIAGLGLMGLVGGAMQLAQRRTSTSRALNMAEGGVDLARAWLVSQAKPPKPGDLRPAANFNFFGTHGVITNPFGDPTGAGDTLTVKIDDDVNNITPGTVTSTPNGYIIESQARLADGTTQTVRAYVQQTSFGRYAFFTNSDPSNLYWVAGRNSFDGPVHTNNADGGQSNVVWKNNTPIYQYQGPDAYTYSGANVNWNYNNPGYVKAPGINDWTSVATTGATGVHQSSAVTMPTVSYRQQYAAMGQPYYASNPPTTPPPGTPLLSGVTVVPGGGIYIHCATTTNDVQQMTLSVDGSGNQVIDVTQTNDLGALTETKVTLDKAANATHILTGAPGSLNALPDVPGTTNGVVYCDGNIGSTGAGATSGQPGKGLAGTIADNQGLTIATDSTKNINIDGSVTYNTPRARYTSSDTIPAGYNVGDFKPESDPANSGFLQNAGTLGLVTKNVQIADNDATGTPLGDVELDATAMAYGTLTATDYTIRAPHNFYCMGGEIANQRGALGQFNSVTLATVSGLSGKYTYDNRLANNPPPFFPTADNNYKVISWQRVTAML